MRKAEQQFTLVAVIAAMLSVRAAAQSADHDAAFNGAVTGAQQAVSEQKLPKAMGTAAQRDAAQAQAAAARQGTMCADAKELETSFILAVDGREMSFSYDSCREEERNDYQAPYTERDYKGPGGYGLTIVTSDGWEPGHDYDGTTSEVLVSKGKDWVGRIGSVANAKLVSGEAVFVGEIKVPGARVAYANLRAPNGVFAQTRTCDAAIAKLAGGKSPRDAQGLVSTGFGQGPSLVLLTVSDAYYYHEDCDICAELDVCDLRTGQAKAAVVSHTVGCSDLDPYHLERGEVFSSCPNPR